MCKDLCREDRERAKERYVEKKRQREAGRIPNNISPATESGTQGPPQEENRNRQGGVISVNTSPQLEGQHNTL